MNLYPLNPGIFAPTEPQLVLLRGSVHLLCSNIVRLEGDGNYTRFVLADGRTILTSKSLGFYARLLPEDFVRVHKSCILNRCYISHFRKLHVMMHDGFTVQVARRKRRTTKVTLKSKTTDKHILF